MPFRISPFVTKNLETMVAPHAMPIAAAQQIVARGSPTSSPLRRLSLRVDLPVPSPLASASSASLFAPPPPGRAPPPAAPPSSASSESLSESLSLSDAHPQHRKPLPPPPHKRSVTSPALSPTPSQHSPSDSSPEAPGKERKEKKEKNKHKKENKEKKKVKSPDVGMGNVRAASPNP